MYTGYLISESFENPEFLNKLKVKKVEVEYFKNAKGTEKDLKVWHLFEVIASEKDILKTSKLVSEKIKFGWYVHFYDSKRLYVIFTNKIFIFPMETTFKSEEYKECFKYAITHGVEKKYMFKTAKEIK